VSARCGKIVWSSPIAKSTANGIIADLLSGKADGIIAAFGDDLNDIEMLRECVFGVAVANALDEVKAAAEALGLSPSAISHQIKRETGMSFKQFRVLRRVLRFEQVIKSNPDLNIQEAALMAGCEDPLYFSRMYKKTRHITPSEYTRLMRDRP
jgi:AraC-like DNA-binding protein